MFRNIAGSVGISLGTALITTRTQVHMAYLSAHTSNADANFVASVASTTAAVRNYVATSDPHATALGYLYQTLIAQSSYLAYIDVFGACALMSFCFVPFTLLFSPVKASGQGGGGH
jgi:DHA2 family multidrug resistance protein